MSKEAVENFAKLLAQADDKERQSLLKRANLIAMNQADPEQFEPPITSLKEYLEKPIEIPPILVEPGILVRGALTSTIGRAGKGKTVMNLNRLMRWAAGKPWFVGLEDRNGDPALVPTQPLKTLIIENEGAAGMFHKQMGVMVHAEDFVTEEERELILQNIMIWGDGGWSGLKLDDEHNLNQVRMGCEQFKPDIVFLEPFRGLWHGEENSATDMARVLDNLVGIAADYDCAILISHHERKTGFGEDGEGMSAGRGSTALEGVVAVMENFQSAKGGDYRELSYSKARYKQAPDTIRMEWIPESWWYKLVEATRLEQTIMNTINELGEALSISQMIEATDESEYVVRKTTSAMVKQGLLKRVTSHGAGGGYRYRTVGDPDIERGGLDI